LNAASHEQEFEAFPDREFNVQTSPLGGLNFKRYRWQVTNRPQWIQDTWQDSLSPHLVTGWGEWEDKLSQRKTDGADVKTSFRREVCKGYAKNTPSCDFYYR
jgi:hypothetical protein